MGLIFLNYILLFNEFRDNPPILGLIILFAVKLRTIERLKVKDLDFDKIRYLIFYLRILNGSWKQSISSKVSKKISFIDEEWIVWHSL